jgi:hypothetical protein
MRYYSEWPFQFSIQKVKKGPFEGILGAFWKNLYEMPPLFKWNKPILNSQ